MSRYDVLTHVSMCDRLGHRAPAVEHLPGHRTRLTCNRCGKSVIEEGLSDHPDAFAKAAVQADLRRRIDDE